MSTNNELVTHYINWILSVLFSFWCEAKNLPAVSWHMNRAGLNIIFTCFGVHTYLLVVVVVVDVFSVLLCAANFCALSTALPNESQQNNTDTIYVILSVSLCTNLNTHLCSCIYFSFLVLLFLSFRLWVLPDFLFFFPFFSYSIRFSIRRYNYNDHINQMCKARLFWQLAASNGSTLHAEVLLCTYAPHRSTKIKISNSNNNNNEKQL